MSEIKSEIKSSLELGEKTAEDETQGGKWRFWNSSPFDYELTEGGISVFKTVLPEGISGFVNERRSKGQKVFVVDLLSTPAMLTHLNIDGGVAIGLGNPPLKELQHTMSQKNISYIPGNILTKKPWIGLSEWKKEHQIPGFDLIISRAQMHPKHHKFIPNRPEVYFSLLNRAWKLLNPNEGTLVFDIPIFESGAPVDNNGIEKWLNILKQNGIESKYSEYSALKLVRRQNSPEKLPSL